jgi:hypothetical protein
LFERLEVGLEVRRRPCPEGQLDTSEQRACVLVEPVAADTCRVGRNGRGPVVRELLEEREAEARPDPQEVA